MGPALTLAALASILRRMMNSPSKPIPTPFECTDLKVLPEWIDGNGHMNVACYLKAFDIGFGAAYDALSLGFDMIERQDASTMAAEMHITYQGELLEGDPMRISTQLIDFDAKRFHWFQTMHHAEKGYLAGTCEWMILFIDMTKRRVAAMPDDLAALMVRVKEAHSILPLPPELGRSISLKNKRRAV